MKCENLLSHYGNMPCILTYTMSYMQGLFDSIEVPSVSKPDNLDILTVSENEGNSMLIQQLSDNEIPFINGYFKSKKISFSEKYHHFEYIYNGLRKCTSDYVLFIADTNVKILDLHNIIRICGNNNILYGSLRHSWNAELNPSDSSNEYKMFAKSWYCMINTDVFVGKRERLLKIFSDFIKIIRTTTIPRHKISERFINKTIECDMRDVINHIKGNYKLPYIINFDYQCNLLLSLDYGEIIQNKDRIMVI